MSSVVKPIKNLFGSDDGGGNSAVAAQTAAIQRQDAALQRKEADLAAAEAGQRRNRSANRGLLAFIDDELKRALG
jgi:hypothetical protein